MRAWEIHPMFVAFPVAFLLGGTVLDLYAAARGNTSSRRTAVGLLTAGFWTGLAAAAAGVLAYFTVPAHTEEAHTLMFWHLGLAAASLALFGWVAWARRPSRNAAAPRGLHVAVAIVAAALLVAAGALGGHLVLRGGAGVDPELLAPEVRAAHSHRGEPAHQHEHGAEHGAGKQPGK